jgi:two-component system LytT family response regulator
MKAIVVDDEMKSREVLKSLLETFCTDVEVIASCEGIEDSIEAIQRLHPDIVFLDINLKHGDSFQILQRLNVLDFKIVFVTAYDEYSVRALRFSGIHCLFKPLDIQELVKTIDELKIQNKNFDMAYEMVNGLLKSKYTTLPVVTSGGIQFKEIDKILYLSSTDKGVEIHLSQGDIMKSEKNIDSFLDIILSKDFLKITDQLVVNITWIDQQNSGSGILKFTNGQHLQTDKSLLYGFLKQIA